MNNAELLVVIDGFLLELGTTGLVDARKARDQLMDLRLMVMSDLMGSVAVAVDPGLIEEINSVAVTEQPQ